MGTRLVSATLAVLLLGGVAVAFATNVQGKDFEHQVSIEQAGQAYLVNWKDDQGKLRLALEPVDGAASPTALLSMFTRSGEHMGTYALDVSWPELDYVVPGEGRYVVMVHTAVDAGVGILTEEGTDATIKATELRTERVELVDGAHEDLSYQVAIHRAQRDAHMAVLFEGATSGLELAAVNEAGQAVLQASVPSLDTEELGLLRSDIDPAKFADGSLLVRLSAESFNGSLALEITSFSPDRNIFVPIDRSTETAPEDEDDEAGDDEENASENATTDDAQLPIEGVVVTELDGEAPVGFDVPAGIDEAYVIGRDGAATATVYDPDDVPIGTIVIDEETDGAIVWDEDKRLVAVPVALDASGEHVVVFRSNYDGFLFLPELDEAPDHRELVVEAVEVSLDDDVEAERDSTLLLFQDTTWAADVELTGGLIGFDFDASLLDTQRNVRILDEDGEEVATGETGLLGAGHSEICPDGEGIPAAAAPGVFTVEVESESILSSSDGSVYLFQFLREAVEAPDEGDGDDDHDDDHDDEDDGDDEGDA